MFSRSRCPKGQLRLFPNNGSRERLGGLRQTPLEQHGEATGESGRIGQLLAFDDPRLVQQQPGKFRQLVRCARFADAGSQPLDQLVPRVDLQNASRGAVELTMLLQQPLEMHVHVALVGDEADGAVGQALGTAHVLDRVAERQLENRNQAGELRRGLGPFSSGVFG